MIGSYKLMHREDPVCDMTFDQYGHVSKVGTVYNEELLPPGTGAGKELLRELGSWMDSRIFSQARPDIAFVRRYLSEDILKHAGQVSLFDTYWFKGPKDTVTWEDINPYDHWDHRRDPVCLLNLRPNYIHADTRMDSPNLSIPGADNAFFCRGEEGKFYFLSEDIEKDMGYFKRAEGSTITQPRKYTIISGRLYSAQESQTSREVESFPMSAVYEKFKGRREDSLDILMKALESVGIDRGTSCEFLREMYSGDEKADIDDREFSSVRLLRNTETLEVLGFAKI
jgi:hypothetical protein